MYLHQILKNVGHFELNLVFKTNKMQLVWVKIRVFCRCVALPEQVFLSEQVANISQSLFRKAEISHLLQPQSQRYCVHQSQTVSVQERQQRSKCIQNDAINLHLSQRGALLSTTCSTRVSLRTSVSHQYDFTYVKSIWEGEKGYVLFLLLFRSTSAYLRILD